MIGSSGEWRANLGVGQRTSQPAVSHHRSTPRSPRQLRFCRSGHAIRHAPRSRPMANPCLAPEGLGFPTLVVVAPDAGAGAACRALNKGMRPSPLPSRSTGVVPVFGRPAPRDTLSKRSKFIRARMMNLRYRSAWLISPTHLSGACPPPRSTSSQAPSPGKDGCSIITAPNPTGISPPNPNPIDS